MHFDLEYNEVEFDISSFKGPTYFHIRKKRYNYTFELKHFNIVLQKEPQKPVCHFLINSKRSWVLNLSLDKFNVVEFKKDNNPTLNHLIPTERWRSSQFLNQIPVFDGLFSVEVEKRDDFEIIKNHLEFRMHPRNYWPKGRPSRIVTCLKRPKIPLRKYLDLICLDTFKGPTLFKIVQREPKSKENITINFNMIHLGDYEELYLALKERYTIEEVYKENEDLLDINGSILDINWLCKYNVSSILDAISSFLRESLCVK
ncbi:hypothetical protein NGRA_2423 [Nosema granulosis]|uniref:Uncharacterized protein n=1 Tax=Nosema granulosis TaxID=83296 RepID=A0A9P6KYF9_9MICR|nr:hypothetical protein NGRA_2423 [Nosema granulosis]